jgi:hypothetical protein
MDKKRLKREYVDKERSSYDLADEWDCDSKTVRNWIDHFGFEKREAKDYHRNEYASYRVLDRGYAYWYDYYGDSRGDSIAVHRLLAISEYGIDAVKGKHVHHDNGVKWDNRPENLELKDPSEHAKEHYENDDLELQPGNIEEML